MKSKYETLSDLKAAEYNPRMISAQALEGLKFSLDEFGDISGVVFNSRTGNLISGHQRVTALKEKYGDLVITRLSDTEGFVEAPNKEIYKIRFVDWPVEKEKAANIAANSESIQGEWTPEVSLLVEEISLTTPELFSGLNFSGWAIPSLEVPEETLEVEKQISNIAQETRNSLKFGDVTIYLSGEELENITRVYKKYIENNKTTYGFVTYLLEGE